MRPGTCGGASTPTEREFPRRRIAITGASGLIGGALARAIEARGDTVLRVGRSARSDVRWDIGGAPLDARALEGVHAVVHLAGEPIGHRWTRARKRAIRSSRVEGTAELSRALAALTPRPAVLVSGSAIGIYGDRGDEGLTEMSVPGHGFLPEVAREWEAATRSAEDAGIRVVHSRTGIVLSRDGGALAKMVPPFRFGIGGRLGSGLQWMSWIALSDAVRALVFLLDHEVSGAVNVVAPNPVRNVDFAQALGSALTRPSVLPVPAAALRLVYGEMADEALLASQRVQPVRLLEAGFTFSNAWLELALRHVLGQ